MVWWTNETQSNYHERSLPLSDRSAVISDLALGTGYYIQINLVAPLNVQVYGETRSFTLDQILSQPSQPLESTHSQSADALLPLTLLLGVLGVLVLLILLIVILYLKRHTLARYCGGPGGGADDPLRRKRHLNGATIDMYDGRIQISAPFNHDTPAEEEQALTPQWPEPEPMPTTAAAESEAFLPKPVRNGNGSGPPSGGRRNSRNSISSSWSSLFNVPTGADGGSVRSSTVSSGNASGGQMGGTAGHRVSFAGIGSGRGYRRPSPNEQV